MSRMSQEMRTILDALLVSTGANLPAMEIGEARSAFATAAADWNVPLPDLEAEDVVLDGVPCRILVPASRKGGTVVLSLLYGCFEPSFNNDSHKRNGDGRYGLSSARMRWYWGNWLGDAHDPRTAPLHADLTGLPWTYLLGAGLDPLCDDTVNLTGRLVAHGVECRCSSCLVSVPRCC